MIEINKKYYLEKEFQYVWCQACYDKLPPTFTIEDREFKKETLEMKNNILTDQESWSQCSSCKRWFHNICALVNNKLMEQNPSFLIHCPECIMKRKEKYVRSQVTMYLPQAKGRFSLMVIDGH